MMQGGGAVGKCQKLSATTSSVLFLITFRRLTRTMPSISFGVPDWARTLGAVMVSHRDINTTVSAPTFLLASPVFLAHTMASVKPFIEITLSVAPGTPTSRITSDVLETARLLETQLKELEQRCEENKLRRTENRARVASLDKLLTGLKMQEHREKETSRKLAKAWARACGIDPSEPGILSVMQTYASSRHLADFSPPQERIAKCQQEPFETNSSLSLGNDCQKNEDESMGAPETTTAIASSNDQDDTSGASNCGDSLKASELTISGEAVTTNEPAGQAEAVTAALLLGGQSDIPRAPTPRAFGASTTPDDPRDVFTFSKSLQECLPTDLKDGVSDRSPRIRTTGSPVVTFLLTKRSPTNKGPRESPLTRRVLGDLRPESVENNSKAHKRSFINAGLGHLGTKPHGNLKKPKLALQLEDEENRAATASACKTRSPKLACNTMGRRGLERRAPEDAVDAWGR